MGNALMRNPNLTMLNRFRCPVMKNGYRIVNA